MIFVTVGTQLAFPRLLGAMNEIAGVRREAVLAQTSVRARWNNMTCASDYSMIEMERYFAQARVIVAHAGIGSVLAARAAGTPLIVVPRRASLGEHRNDHQMATARALVTQSGVWVAWDVCDLAALIDADLDVAGAQDRPLQESLISAVRDFALS